MSYLRALVRKTQAVRPSIAPLLPAPATRPGPAVDELVEDVIVTSTPPAPPASAASAALPVVAVPPRAMADPINHENGRPSQQPPSDAAAAARAAANAMAEAPAPLQPSVSRSSRLISRRLVAPPPGDAAVPEIVEWPPPADRDARPLVAMAKPPPAGPASPSLARAQRPSPILRHERDVERPDVRISIGRLEVRAHVAAPAKIEPEASFRPRLTLQEFLARRSGGN